MLKKITMLTMMLSASSCVMASENIEELKKGVNTLSSIAHLLTAEEQELPIFERLVSLLTQQKADFRIVEHEPEGRSDKIAEIRGNEPKQGAKALVTMSPINKEERIYHLAVLPGNEALDFNKIANFTNSKRTMMAPLDRVEKLTACGPGYIPPFSFSQELKIIVEPSLLDNQEIVFNAGRLDRSIFLKTQDYIRIVRPYLIRIIK
jgi:Ala-tRNA(Pro) deacylase